MWFELLLVNVSLYSYLFKFLNTFKIFFFSKQILKKKTPTHIIIRLIYKQFCHVKNCLMLFLYFFIGLWIKLLRGYRLGTHKKFTSLTHAINVIYCKETHTYTYLYSSNQGKKIGNLSIWYFFMTTRKTSEIFPLNIPFGNLGNLKIFYLFLENFNIYYKTHSKFLLFLPGTSTHQVSFSIFVIIDITLCFSVFNSINGLYNWLFYVELSLRFKKRSAKIFQSFNHNTFLWMTINKD